MKSDSKSGLRLQYILQAVITLVVIIPIISVIITNKNIQVASLNNQEETMQEENVQEQTNQEENNQKETNQEENSEETQTLVADRQIQTASRSSEERTTNSVEQEVVEEQAETENYISIDEITISRDMDLTKRCGISKEDFRTLMANLRVDTSGFFEENADTIYDLCEKYEINEIFYCGLIGAEAGFNISSGHRNKHNYISMMSKGSLIRYATVEEGLEAGLKLLHKTYLTPGGSCYSGKTLASVQRRFCPNSSTWVNLVYTCMKKIV